MTFWQVLLTAMVGGASGAAVLLLLAAYFTKILT